jgi:hydrogenase maturation protein HypF
VQGVGFRPFIYRLATGLGLTGWVINSSQGVQIEAEGERPTLETFLLRIEQEKPPRSFIQSFESSFLDPVGYTDFEIRRSDETGEKTAVVLPDIATCPDCLREIFDPTNRRYLYPFTNCTNCGPRFSIIQALPYDRPNTTMRGFFMCKACRAEYTDPNDRRFDAQPNACPKCGPRLELWDSQGHVLASTREALSGAAEAIRKGSIVAVKGIGGFQLMVDARNEEAVIQLRLRKRREEKPFALMMPSLDMAMLYCEVSALEARLLRSPEAPIVLLWRKTAPAGVTDLAPFVAPGNPSLGVMLPYSPLHHLLMAELGFPVVATSGNLSDEPICIDENEALERLGRIADVFLVHNRPIARHVDDSVARVMLGREQVLRRARGYAPLPVHVKTPTRNVLAVGAHLKNTIAISAGSNVFTSQHIGDLETTQAFDAFERVIASFEKLYEHRPAVVACDAHPDYLSTQVARQRAESLGVPLLQVQHHYAHVLACMAENEIDPPVLGISWDGTGYGVDGTVWGGEFLRVTQTSTDAPFERVAHLRTFRLPGGDRAIKEPKRVAIGLLYELFGDDVFDMAALAPVRAFSAQELGVLRTMLHKGLNTPVTSSAGRLFDAVSALTGLRQQSNYEGQAAMELEFALGRVWDGTNDRINTDEYYRFDLIESTTIGRPSGIIIDWGPTVRDVIDEISREIPTGVVSAKFHNTLVEMMVAVARRVGETRVVLTGGCFQNRYLTERTVRRLESENLVPYWHQRIPPNDGGIALGQVMAAARERPGERPKE